MYSMYTSLRNIERIQKIIRKIGLNFRRGWYIDFRCILYFLILNKQSLIIANIATQYNINFHNIILWVILGTYFNIIYLQQHIIGISGVDGRIPSNLNIILKYSIG